MLRRTFLSIAFAAFATLVIVPGPWVWADLPDSGYDTASITNPGGALTDYSPPVDLSRMSTDWWAAVDTTDGTKGRVALDVNGTEVPADWIDFDDTAETGWLRFEWSGTLPSTGTNVVRIYPPQAANSSYAASSTYGSDNAYQTSVTGYWPDGGSIDRTVNGYDGTGAGSVSFGGAVGKVGAATDYDGSSQYSDLGNPVLDDIEAANALAIMIWANPDAIASDGALVSSWSGDSSLLTWLDVGGAGAGYAAIVRDSSNGLTRTGEDTATATAGSWAFVSMTWDGTTLIVYVDGQESARSESARVLNPTPNPLGIAADADNSRHFDGLLNDVQVHSVARSADWIAEEYAATNDQATFWGTWTWNAPSGGNIVPLVNHYHRMRRAEHDPDDEQQEDAA